MKQTIKKYGRLGSALLGFVYDYIRYIRHAGWSASKKDPDITGYHLVKIYHALEKSMSYRAREPGHGWATATLLIEELEQSAQTCHSGFYYNEALRVLHDFVELEQNRHSDKADSIRQRLGVLAPEIPEHPSGSHAIKQHSADAFRLGMLSSPEHFFLSRYSLREFADAKVSPELVSRALENALKTPSVCNRQPWHVYNTSERRVIDAALSFQSGNRGFGHKVPNLMLITVDLKAFMPGTEHYQYWIDGGLFSMSIIYALHSLGIASCCLNWSQSPVNDLKLRKALNLRDSHTLVMMLAYGWPNESNTVCRSLRKPAAQYLSTLELK